MNNKVRNLIDKVNEKLELTPLIYISKDPERALGLEQYLQNYHILSIDNNHITKSLKNKLNIFSSEELNIDLKSKTVVELLKSPKVIEHIKSISKDKLFYAQFFQFQKPSAWHIQSLNGKVLNNSPEVNRVLEDKISQTKLFKDFNVSTPNNLITRLGEKPYQEITAILGESIVIQLDRAHTGLGTFFAKNELEFNNLIERFKGNDVRVSSYINGESYTINSIVKKDGTVIYGPLQYQITGVKELTDNLGSTCGNDWSFGKELDSNTKLRIYSELNKIGAMLHSLTFIGHFGIDLLIDKDHNIYVIEVNARQTANSSLETKLAIKQDKVPLMLLNLCELLSIDYDVDQNEVIDLDGSQVFLRTKVDTETINNDVKSGVYRLQSDNSAINWDTLQHKEDVIFLDEDRDKPLIFQNDGYSIDDIKEGGFLLLSSLKGSKKFRGDEKARIQLTNKSVYNSMLSPWIIETMVQLERRMR